MWVWALRGSRHFKPAAYSVQPQLPHRGELIIVSLGLSEALRKAKGGLLSASVWVSGQTTLSWGQPLRPDRALLVTARVEHYKQHGRVRYPAQRP